MIDDEIALVTRINELRAQGCSYREIATALEREGFKPRRAEHWQPAMVRRVLGRSERRSATS